MARRISGFKTIEKSKVQTDAGKFELRIYMGKDYGDKGTQFKAVCEHFDIEETADDLDDAKAAAIKLIKERAVVDWKPFLYVKVSGSSNLEPLEEDEAFIEERGTEDSMDLTIQVKQVELSDANGKKQHRLKGYYNKIIREDWPEVGLPEPDGPEVPIWRRDRGHRSMKALVPDTPENRAAFSVLRDGLRTMLRQLEELLSPDHIEQALQTALNGKGVLMLVAETKKQEKSKPNKRRKRTPRRAKR